MRRFQYFPSSTIACNKDVYSVTSVYRMTFVYQMTFWGEYSSLAALPLQYYRLQRKVYPVTFVIFLYAVRFGGGELQVGNETTVLVTFSGTHTSPKQDNSLKQTLWSMASLHSMTFVSSVTLVSKISYFREISHLDFTHTPPHTHFTHTHTRVVY